MGTTPLTHAEHSEFEKRIEADLQRLADEDKRQNKRLDKLEHGVDSLQAVSLNVEKLAVNMGYMCEEQKKQGERLGRLESRDGEMWREASKYALAAVVGGIITLLFPMLKG